MKHALLSQLLTKNITIVVCFVLCNLLHNGNTQNFAPFPTKCEHNYVMDITNGQMRDNQDIRHNNVTYPEYTYFHKGLLTYGCVCNVQICISKCCTDENPENCQFGLPREVAVDIHHDNLTLAVINATHVSTPWKVCDHYIIISNSFYLKKNGKMYFADDGKHYDLDSYCIDSSESANAATVRLCHDNNKADEEYSVDLFAYGMLISIPFLFTTLVIYLILPDKTTQTKCLMAVVTCLMMAYLFLVNIQFNHNMQAPACQIFAACAIYFFMASFCWMTVTCVDMYLIISGKLTKFITSKWIYYAICTIFANGTPLILLAIIFAINRLEEFDGHPGFGNGQCWLSHGLAELLYFYGPMAFLLIVNIIIFALITCKMRQMDRHESNKRDYVMYIKILIVMGMNWAFEIVSWFANWQLGPDKVSWIWYPTDMFNSIDGIIIFIVFVCNKAVWKKLKQRFRGPPTTAQLSTHTSGYEMN